MPTKSDLYREIELLESRLNSYRRVIDFYKQTEEMKDVECSICKTGFEKTQSFRENLFMTSCKHHFHYSCLRRWLLSYEDMGDATCPYCREKFNNLVFYELLTNE